MLASGKAFLLIMVRCLKPRLCHSIIIRCPLSGMLVVLQFCVLCLRYYVHLLRRTLYQCATSHIANISKSHSRQGHISFSSTFVDSKPVPSQSEYMYNWMQILPLFVLIDNTGENVTHLQHTLWLTVINLVISNDVLHHWCWCGHSLTTVHRHHQQQQQWSQIQ